MATQIESLLRASPNGPLPVGMSVRRAPLSPARVTVPSLLFATQTIPGPAATPNGRRPTGIGLPTTCGAAGGFSVTVVPSPVDATAPVLASPLSEPPPASSTTATTATISASTPPIASMRPRPRAGTAVGADSGRREVSGGGATGEVGDGGAPAVEGGGAAGGAVGGGGTARAAVASSYAARGGVIPVARSSSAARRAARIRSAHVR